MFFLRRGLKTHWKSWKYRKSVQAIFKANRIFWKKNGKKSILAKNFQKGIGRRSRKRIFDKIDFGSSAIDFMLGHLLIFHDFWADFRLFPKFGKIGILVERDVINRTQSWNGLAKRVENRVTCFALKKNRFGVFALNFEGVWVGFARAWLKKSEIVCNKSLNFIKKKEFQ